MFGILNMKISVEESQEGRAQHSSSAIIEHVNTFFNLQTNAIRQIEKRKQDIITCSLNGEIKIWDSKNFQLKKSLTCSELSPAEDYLCMIVLESGLIISGSNNGMIRIWDPDIENSLVFSHNAHKLNIRALIVMPVNGYLVSGSWDHKIKIWTKNENRDGPVQITHKSDLIGHTSGVYCLLVLNAEHIASGSADKTIRIWNIITEESKYVLNGHTSTIYSLVKLDNTRIASGSQDQTIKFWSVKSEGNVVLKKTTALLSLEAQSTVRSLIRLPKSDYFASASSDKKIHIWDLEGNRIQTECVNDGLVFCLSLTDQNDLFCSGDSIMTKWRLTYLN